MLHPLSLFLGHGPAVSTLSVSCTGSDEVWGLSLLSYSGVCSSESLALDCGCLSADGRNSPGSDPASLHKVVSSYQRVRRKRLEKLEEPEIVHQLKTRRCVVSVSCLDSKFYLHGEKATYICSHATNQRCFHRIKVRKTTSKASTNN